MTPGTLTRYRINALTANQDPDRALWTIDRRNQVGVVDIPDMDEDLILNITRVVLTELGRDTDRMLEVVPRRDGRIAVRDYLFGTPLVEFDPR